MRWFLMAAMVMAGLQAAKAQQAEETAPPRASIWDVKVGMAVDDLPGQDFIEIACGTNGGPPSLPLDSFEDFMKCKPEDTGLREVTFRYDDELEYWALANEYTTWIEFYAGTNVLDHPVILSVLISEDAVVRGVRIITDPRADPRARQAAVRLKKQLEGRFGDGPWTCRDAPPAEGEKPARGLFIKERCEKIQETGHGPVKVLLSADWYHKPGQQLFDPHTGAQQPGYFESATRVEIYDPAYSPETG